MAAKEWASGGTRCHGTKGGSGTKDGGGTDEEGGMDEEGGGGWHG